MRTTFLNCRKEDRKTFRANGRKHLEGRAEDFKFWHEWGTEKEDLRYNEDFKALPDKKQAKVEDLFDSIGSFHNYGLSIDYQQPEGRRRGYLRYQLSWGGPSDEVRFYFSGDGSRGQADKIEYVFMDWGTGVGFDVSNEDWAQWLWDWFQGADIVRYEFEKALED
jgi:hypothetical protein